VTTKAALATTLALLASLLLAPAAVCSSAGREMYDTMVAEGAVYDDVELQEYVTRIGQRLVANSDMPDTKFTFTVIDSPDINAFATPGAYIYVNRGLLAYLDNEAELAGVLGHEIAHVTARHASRQKTAHVTNKVLATTLGILTNNRNVMDAAGMYGQELVSGYGREHELEADGLGAEYMHKAGYDVDALLEVIGVLKDQEQFQRVKAKSTGRKVATYHGLYASHPRNDQRLQTVVRAANELEVDGGWENPENPGEFRRQMEGLAWGSSGRALRSEQRFYHNKLLFSFARPEGWDVSTAAKAIVAAPAAGGRSLTLTIQRQDRSQSPEALLRAQAADLSKGRKLEQAGLQGFTGIDPAGPRRLASIDYNGLTYLFSGAVDDSASFSDSDQNFVEIIESFRPMAKSERKVGKPQYIQYIRAPRGTTFAKLATGVRIPDAEVQLRLINGYYPSGEPRTGDWIKVIR
jgi:predicted Zn-dependent protease